MKTMTLDNYVSTIDAFNKTRPDMMAVRTHNHQMVDLLNKLHPFAGKSMLDVGASPHGYTLERALQLGAASYTGIGLGVDSTRMVQYRNNIGKLENMNAECLTLGNRAIDVILSISTFEHFANGPQVLKEMYRVLKPGGSALITFQPVWTSSYGHHLHHLPAVAELIPPWAHLLWTEETMKTACQARWPSVSPMSLQDAIHWIYRSNEINRVTIAELRTIFSQSNFVLNWMTPVMDDATKDKPEIAAYLSRVLPYSKEDLMTLGLSLYLTKSKVAL